MSFQIRNAKVADAAPITFLLNGFIRAGAETIMNETIRVEDQRAYIQSMAPKGVYLVALDEDGTILGVQGIEPLLTSLRGVVDHVGVISTFVAESSQGRGIGRALCAASFTAAKGRFLKIMAMIRGDNLRAQAFYQNQGFQRIGVARQHTFVGDRFYVDQAMMERFV